MTASPHASSYGSFRRTGLPSVLASLALAICGSIWFASTGFAEEIDVGANLTQPAPEDLAAYGGRWNRIVDTEAEEMRRASIETAIEDLSWIVRRMAAGVLKKSTAPPPEMKFDWDGERLHQLVDGRNGESRRPVRIGGDSQVLIDPRGEAFSSNWLWTESGLRVDWSQKQAYGSNLYRIEHASQTLTVEHQIHVTAMSGIDPIMYRSSFKRDGLPAVAAAANQ